jgi:hypothetical protein
MVGGPVIAGGRVADDFAVSGAITVVGASGRRWRTYTSVSRGFSLSLPPGVYRVIGASPMYDNGKPLCGAPPVKVAPRKTAQVKVICSVD